MLQQACFICFCLALPWTQDVPPETLLDSEPQAVQNKEDRTSVFLRDSAWHRGSVAQHRAISGKWQLAWNDEISGKPGDYPHECVVEFTEINGAISGKFIGKVAGRERHAIISGRLEGTGATKVITFQQREQEYVCSFQAIDAGGAITGVWHDTQNRSGCFRMLKYQ